MLSESGMVNAMEQRRAGSVGQYNILVVDGSWGGWSGRGKVGIVESWRVEVYLRQWMEGECVCGAVSLWTGRDELVRFR